MNIKTLKKAMTAGSLLALFAGIALGQEQKGQAIHYRVTDLGLVGPTPGPLAIQNNGLFAESVAVSNAWHAAISFQGRTPIDLAKTGGLGGPNSAGFGVNESVQAAGEAETVDSNSEDFCGFGTQHVCAAFLWQNGVMRALPLLRDENGVEGQNAGAKGINIWGQVAGSAENTTLDSTCPAYDTALLQYQTYQFKPVIWTHGEIRQLPTADIDSKGKAFNDPDGVVFSISDSGQAVGATGTCTGFTGFSYLNALHATLWRNGSVIDLGNLGGTGPQPPLGFGNFAYDVNSSGQVVGTSGTSDGLQHAFFWSPETLIQDVGTISSDVASVGLAISDLGDIGGISFPAGSLLAVPTASPRAFLRPKGGTMVDLNSLIPADSELYLFSTCSINSRGEIIGLALDPQFNLHGYLAIPTNSAADSMAELSAESRSSRFAYAWQVLRDRRGPFRAGWR